MSDLGLYEVFVFAQETSVPKFTPNSATIDSSKIRLIGGSDAFEGRVEIFYEGVWGTVCDKTWDFQSAKAVCRLLGFDGALAAPGAAAYGQGSGRILGCDSTDDKLDCYHQGIGVLDCHHDDDAGVRCFMGSDPFNVRLMGGDGADGAPDGRQGRVEILYDGAWGTVCDSHWDVSDATVVCRMLDFDGALEATHSANFDKGSGDSILDGVRCRGSEEHLADCMHGGFGSNVCSHEKDAGAICYSNAVTLQYCALTLCSSTASSSSFQLHQLVRLVGGSNAAEGRVEIQQGGRWGTVCHDQWDSFDATVVCRMLGFQGALEALGSAHFGKGSGEIFMDEVQCEGTELRLTDCKHNGIGEHNCAHNEDASVVCDTFQKGCSTNRNVGVIVGAVLGTIILILMIFIGVAVLILWGFRRIGRNKKKDKENLSPSFPSEIMIGSLEPEGIKTKPPKLPARAFTFPIGFRKGEKSPPGGTVEICQSPKPEDADPVGLNTGEEYIYMSMETEYMTPSASNDDHDTISNTLHRSVVSDEEGTAAVKDSVYMGDEQVEADNLSDIEKVVASKVEDDITSE
nr:deleted in malignant brain tumors 1 protein-like [Lytechinus pictus]